MSVTGPTRRRRLSPACLSCWPAKVAGADQRPHPAVPLPARAGVLGPDRRRPARGYLALADNGVGAKANSADFRLRAYRIRPRWERAGGGPGTVEVLGFVQFRDPDRRVAWPIVNQDSQDRLLTGADFDPESIRRAPDGTLWVGDEFGPFLLHFSAAGVLLEAPVPFPVPRRLAGYGGGQDEVRSPDNPALFGLPEDAARVAAANLPRSRGIEGMALSSDGRTLYPSLEGALVADPTRTAGCCTPTTWPGAGSGTGQPTTSPTPPPTPSAT